MPAEEQPTSRALANDTGPSARPPAHGRQPSLSVQSRMRSTSFRKSSGAYPPGSPTSATVSTGGAKAPTLPALSPEGDAVTEIYRKQAARLEELERESRRLAKELEAADSRWRRSEEELEELRESNAHVPELRKRAERADSMIAESIKLVS